MLLKSLKTEINGNLVSINFPDKKSIILRGENGIQLLHVLESLLSNDFTGYMSDKDKQYGFHYKPISGMSQLSFNTGDIYGKDKSIHIQGSIPKIHCIRYLGACNKIRSFLISDQLEYSELYIDTTKYSQSLEVSQWVRLSSLVNDVVGFNMVTFENSKLKIKFLEDYTISIEGQQIIYLLIAECFVTPRGYSRIVLLPDIPYLTGELQVKLIETIDNINGHTLALSTGDIKPSDLSHTSVVSFINI